VTCVRNQPTIKQSTLSTSAGMFVVTVCCDCSAVIVLLRLDDIALDGTPSLSYGCHL